MKLFKLLLFIFTVHSLSAEIIPQGLGSYTNTLPAGQKGPSNREGNPVTPKVTAAFNKPITTHKWWSSILWQNDPANPYSENLFAYPISAHAQSRGLDIGYPTTPAITPDIITGQGWKAQEYHYELARDLTIGVANLTSADTKVDNYSDWTVTAAWQGNNRSLKITLGRGLPFVYCIATGDKAQIICANAPTIWYNQNETVGITINGKNYGLFAPIGSAWEGTTTLQSSLNGKDYFSVALLPDNKTETLLFFRKYAYAFVTGTKVKWSYAASNAMLTTTYTVTTTLKETAAGLVNQPLLALFRHQWLHSTNINTSYTYISPRGSMKLMSGSSFTTTMPFHGILPTLPLVAKDGVNGFSTTKLYNDVDQIYKQDYLTRWSGLTVEQSYWIGKALQRISHLIFIADQVNHTKARDLFLKELKEKLQAWYSATDTPDQRVFYYDEIWQTLIGYPASFGSDTELNDHHFHWGYYIFASAVVAHFDPAWAKNTTWGAMVKLLIKDVANWSRVDLRFPYLRQFDVYAGHSFANGPAAFAAGNNQESSSESINFSAGAFLFGAATNNAAIRDLGIYLHVTEAEAIKQYWFDVEDAVFPAGFTKPALGILWGNGGSYAIWWGGTVQEVHGINFMPITPASLHLGEYPEYLKLNQAYMLTNNSSPATWPDIHMSVKALYDSQAVITQFNSNPNYAIEGGESRAHTYHWIYNIDTLGRVDPTVTADTPSYAVFVKNGKRNYIAYNYSATATTVTFSDGIKLAVPARSLATSASTTPVPPPNPDPDPEPEPEPNPTDKIFTTADFTAKLIAQDTKILVQFAPTAAAIFVDLHYTINDVNQQNIRMVFKSQMWEFTIPTIKTGDILKLFFTYTKNGSAYDSAWFTANY